MKIEKLSRTLAILAGMIAEMMGVKVVLGAHSTYTDGGTIHIGTIDADDENATTLALGRLLHEALHILRSDFSLKFDSDLHQRIDNLLEDIRVEALGHKRYAGARKWLHDLMVLMIQSGAMSPVNGDEHEGALLHAYMLYRLRNDVLGQPFKELADGAEKALAAKFPAGAITRLDGLMYSVTKCQTETEVSDLARSIIKMLKEEQEKAQQQAQQQTQSQGQSCSGQQQSNGVSGGPLGDGADVDGNVAQSGQDTSSDSGNKGSQDGRDQAIAGNANPGNVGNGGAQAQADALARAINASMADLGRDTGELIQEMLQSVTRKASSDNVLREPQEVSNGKSLRFSQRLADVRRETNALRQRLSGMLQARSLSSRYATTQGKRIDRRAMVRLSHGDPRVFTRVIDGIKTDTAVMVLVDMSRSMRGAPATVAMDSALATVVAMDGIPGVSVCASWFNSGVGLLTDFGEKPDQTSGRYRSSIAGGGTNLASALLHGGRKLLAQRQPRKIMLVLSDGQPEQHELCKKMFRMLHADGIETLGIGVLDPAIAQLMDRTEVINQLSELPSAMVGLLQDALLKAA